jgi:DNA ligase (NAD+)
MLEALNDEGLLTSPADFYTLQVDDMLELDRVGRRLAEKLVGRVEAKREVPVATFLRALGIEELGSHVSKILAREYDSIDEILQVEAEELAAIHTIGDIIADKVTTGLATHRELIEELLEEVDVVFPPSATEVEESDSPVAGKAFLFTGTLESMKRKDAQKHVEERGGLTPSGVKKDLDFLVIGDADLERFESGWRSGKLKKAEKYNGSGSSIQIIGESQFLEMLGIE